MGGLRGGKRSQRKTSTESECALRTYCAAQGLIVSQPNCRTGDAPLERSPKSVIGKDLLAGALRLLLLSGATAHASRFSGVVAYPHPSGQPLRVRPCERHAVLPIGDTRYGLYSDSPITTPLRAQYLKTRRTQRFNFVRMHAMPHRPIHEGSDPKFWAWGGTPQEPDLDRFNPAYFRGLDELLQKMKAVGMNAELILLNFYLWPGTDPKVWTPERERHWLRYVTARYAAFSNVFLWTIANEYETHPDGKYRLDLPGDVEWAKATARTIKQHDPYRHPVTIHPVVSASTVGDSPRSPFWRLQPFDGITGEAQALAVRGERYALYLPHGGSVSVDLGALPGSVTARWFNPRDGRWGWAPAALGAVATAAGNTTAEGGGRREFTAPDAHDWALVITPTVARTQRAGRLPESP